MLLLLVSRIRLIPLFHIFVHATVSSHPTLLACCVVTCWLFLVLADLIN
jgi:hypothetical protein